MTPKEYSFTFTPEETQLVINALGAVPINLGFDLFQKIKNEVIKQEAVSDQKGAQNGQ